MKDFILFLDLIRLKKPIGIMLLFWPCLWGLTLANDFTNDNLQYVIYFIYFFLGSVLKGVGALVAAIGLGQIIAGYLYPNTSEELTSAVEDFEKK